MEWIFRDIPISVAQHPYEKQPALLDFIQAESKCLIPLTLFFTNTPTKIHLDKVNITLSTEFPEFRLAMRHQFIPLILHITEGGRNEFPYDTRGLLHGLL